MYSFRQSCFGFPSLCKMTICNAAVVLLSLITVIQPITSDSKPRHVRAFDAFNIPAPWSSKGPTTRTSRIKARIASRPYSIQTASNLSDLTDITGTHSDSHEPFRESQARLDWRRIVEKTVLGTSPPTPSVLASI